MLRSNIKLLPFQEEGVTFMENRQGNMILGDEQGCGKTIQAIAYTDKHNLRTIIICPAYLKYNWADEIKKFTNKTSAILTSKTTNLTDVYLADYVIVNYEIVHDVGDLLLQLDMDIAVCDESQYLMNPNSKRTKATLKVLKKIPKRILMSGTPIKNKVSEFYDQLKLVQPYMESKKDYMDLYGDCAKINLKSHEVNSSSLTYLHHSIKSFFLRRTKKDVLKDLPPKQFQVIRIDKTVKLEKKRGLEYITHAKKTLSRSKLTDLYKIIDDHLENEQKIIVYSQYVSNIKTIISKYDSAVPHYGGIDIKKRSENVKQFQKDPNTKILVGNIATAVGYTATSATVVIFLDLPWTVADLKQAEDRAHRISQKNHVTIQYLIVKDSLEELILKLLQSKEKLMKAVLDGEKSEESLDIRRELLRMVA